MAGYQRDDRTPEQIEHETELYGALADEVRRLADASIRTEVDDDTVRDVTAQLREIADRLQVRQASGPYGIRFDDEGHGRPWGNAVVGLRNPVAPPLDVRREKLGEQRGRAWAKFRLGAAYEGPPGLVHGGVSALILDQMLGEACGAAGVPGMTGTLTLKYRRPTPLGELSAEARVDRVEEIKTWATGAISDADGNVCVEAEGVFILSKWAREAVAKEREKQTRFE